jgi:hypothetical protein
MEFFMTSHNIEIPLVQASPYTHSKNFEEADPEVASVLYSARKIDEITDLALDFLEKDLYPTKGGSNNPASASSYSKLTHGINPGKNNFELKIPITDFLTQIGLGKSTPELRYQEIVKFRQLLMQEEYGDKDASSAKELENPDEWIARIKKGKKIEQDDERNEIWNEGIEIAQAGATMAWNKFISLLPCIGTKDFDPDHSVMEHLAKMMEGLGIMIDSQVYSDDKM